MEDNKYEKKPRKDYKSDRGMDGAHPEVSRKKRGRPAIDAIFDYKDIETLSQYVGEDGKIIAARITRLNAKQQKELSARIKRARQLALLPVSTAHM